MYFDVDVALAETPEQVPLRSSPDELYSQFIETQEKFLQNLAQAQKLKKLDPNETYDEQEDPEEAEILELANMFEGLIKDHLNLMMKLRSRRTMADDDVFVCKKLEIMLREERNTWRLAKALIKDRLLDGTHDSSHDDSHCSSSDRMDDSTNGIVHQSNGNYNNHQNDLIPMQQPGYSDEQIIGNYYVTNTEIRRMQAVADWLETNAADDLDYKDEEDKVEFYSEGPHAWENTFHAMRTKCNIDIDIPDLDLTVNPNAGVELCSAMDPDAPIRSKRSLMHSDKEVEIRLFKHLFRFMRAGKLDEGQELAQRAGYQWLSAALDGWLPYSDPNLDEEHLARSEIIQPQDYKPVSGNKKRDVWKLACFKSSRVHGLTSCEKAVLGVLGGNLKSVVPICRAWSDQLWARLKCSIDVKIEQALRDPQVAQFMNKQLIDYPQEFYDNYQDIKNIFNSIDNSNMMSTYKEETIHQTIQKHLILNDMDALLNQLERWCLTLDYGNDLSENTAAVSPHFLRFFAHVVLFLRDLKLVSAEDARGTKIIEAYIDQLILQKSIESVAHYTVFLPAENQILTFAKLLATINDREEREQCLQVAVDFQLDVNEITQTVVEMIFKESTSLHTVTSTNFSHIEETKTTSDDRRKINSLDYLLYLKTKNYVAILHHGLVLLRFFALQRKIEALKDTFLKLPNNLAQRVEEQWALHTNRDISLGLRNNLRELEGFRVMLESQEMLSLWSEEHHKKPEAPKKPANLTKFCDNVNYEQRLEQYQHDKEIWERKRETMTTALVSKVEELFMFTGGWMKDIVADPTEESDSQQEAATSERQSQMERLRKIYIPQMTFICFNVLQLTNRYKECLKLSHLLAKDDELRLYEDFSKIQLREFLDKISEVTKVYVNENREALV